MKYYIDGKKQGQVGYAIRSAFLEWWDTTNLPPAASVRSITFDEGFTSGTHESLVRDEGGRLKSPITVNVADFQLAEPLPAHLVEAYFGVSV